MDDSINKIHDRPMFKLQIQLQIYNKFQEAKVVSYLKLNITL
jgi:hypothetical protein